MKLGEIFTIERGGSPRPIEDFITNDPNGLNWIKIGDTKGVTKYITKTQEKIRPEGLKKTRMVYEGDFILSNSMSFGRPYIMRTSGCIHDGWLVIRNNKEVNTDFLYYSLSSNAVYSQFSKLAKGSTVKNLNIEAVKQVEISLPPLPTQQAIVSKIEELFSELDKGVEQLKTAQQQLKTYRQAVLKWAFEGRLTNEEVKEGELPEGWKIQKLCELGTWKGGGTPSKSNKEFWEGGTVLWVSPKDMKEKIIQDSIDKITSNAIENSSTKLIAKGSVLFVVRSGILRRTLPVAISGKEVTVNQDLQAFTPTDISVEYVYWYVQAKNEQIRKDCSKDGTTVESIETTLLKNYFIPVASKKEQSQIVLAIESRLSVADKLEESIAESLQKAEALRQSILKRAFEGELVA